MEETKMNWIKKLVFVALILLVPAASLRGQGVEENTVEAASAVLREIMSIPMTAIPESLLAEAQGVVIIPGMVKGAFIVGVRHGKGVVVARIRPGRGGASVHHGDRRQRGVAGRRRVHGCRGGLSQSARRGRAIAWQVDARRGCVGGRGAGWRDASAATDALLKAEILSYSRSRGLFAGVAIDGAALLINHRANAAFYAPRPGLPKDAIPASAVNLVEQIAAYAGHKPHVMVNLKEALAILQPADDVEMLCTQLAESSLRQDRILDSQWKGYLKLPAEFFAEGKTPPREVVDSYLGRYNVVANDARYHELSSRAEFRETHALLTRYRSALEGNAATLKLPPPPR